MTAHRTTRAADRSLFKIETRVRYLKSQMLAAGKAHTRAEDAMGAWYKRNPGPKMRRAYICPEGNPNSDLEAAKREHQKALAQYERRETKAAKACNECERAWERSIARVDAQCKRAVGIRATSLDGLRCKARLVEAEDPVGLAFSIVNDLIALSGSASPA
jgi:hypothetical protein